MDVSLPATSKDRRSSSRRRSLLSGIVTSASGSFTADCAIKNLSADGAQIVLGSDQIVTEDCVLINLKDAVVYVSHIEWGRPSCYGLRFLDSYHLEGAVPSKLLFAKRLWLARRGLIDNLG
jgi:hypothetical protein